MVVPGHTGILGTLALTQTAVTTDTAGSSQLTSTGARVHGDGLLDNEAIADELADGLTGVGVGDLGHLIGVEPNLALAAADHGGRKALLGAKVDPEEEKRRSQPLHLFHSIESFPISGLGGIGSKISQMIAGRDVEFAQHIARDENSHLDVGVSTVVGG